VSEARLVFFLHGLPDYEALFPLACRLAERGLPVVCYGASAALRREPRLRQLIAAAPVAVRLWPNRLLKRLAGLWLRPDDVAVVLSDPALDGSATVARSAYLRKHAIASIFVQHGVIQTMVNYPVPDPAPNRFHSGLLLLYDDPVLATSLVPEARARARQVGFLKAPILAPRPPGADFEQMQAGYSKTVLICHSFRWSERYSNAEIEAFYDLVVSLARGCPDHLFILRGHRGKTRSIHGKNDRALLRQNPNIVMSRARSGPLAGMGMLDVLALSDLVISTASTALLDSLYAGKMAAVYRNEHPVYEALPNIETPRDAMRFLENPAPESGAAMMRRFGMIEANLDRAAEEIAAFLKSRGVRNQPSHPAGSSP